jgi:hypothetical protein
MCVCGGGGANAKRIEDNRNRTGSEISMNLKLIIFMPIQV